MQFKQKKEQNNKFTIESNRKMSQNKLIKQMTGLNSTPQVETSTISSGRMILKVYLTDDSRMFIDRAAAYSLGFIDTRAIMLDDTQKIQISEKDLSIIKTKNSIEIEYEKLLSKEDVPAKQKIIVYVDNVDYYISVAAAYSLGLINVEVFNNISNQLFNVSDNLMVFLKNKYDIVYTEMEKPNKKVK